jgi:hypothetical protein
MSQDEAVGSLLARHGLKNCPDCKTAITSVNIGWNPVTDLLDVFPIVYIACTQCQKRLVVIQVSGFAESLDDAIQKANQADKSN